MIEILINPNGDDFARVLNNQIRLLKRRAIGQKLYDYYYTNILHPLISRSFAKWIMTKFNQL